MAICSKRKYNSFEENSVFIKHKINALCLFVKTKKNLLWSLSCRHIGCLRDAGAPIRSVQLDARF